jgi:hypothetical protein
MIRVTKIWDARCTRDESGSGRVNLSWAGSFGCERKQPIDVREMAVVSAFQAANALAAPHVHLGEIWLNTIMTRRRLRIQNEMHIFAWT